jgi:hypothetical protein
MGTLATDYLGPLILLPASIQRENAMGKDSFKRYSSAKRLKSKGE